MSHDEKDSLPIPTWMWGALLVTGLFALRQAISGWRLAASGDLGPEGDISVYIGAINFLRDGGALYDYPLEGGYGFTYPPFAAIVLRPFTWLDPRTTGLVWLTLCIAVAVVVVVLVVATRNWPVATVGRVAVLGLAVGASWARSKCRATSSPVRSISCWP